MSTIRTHRPEKAAKKRKDAIESLAREAQTLHSAEALHSDKIIFENRYKVSFKIFKSTYVRFSVIGKKSFSISGKRVKGNVNVQGSFFSKDYLETLSEDFTW